MNKNEAEPGHHHTHSEHNESDTTVGLLEPENCEQFLQVAEKNNHFHVHDHDHHHDHDHDHNHAAEGVTWRLILMISLTGIFFFAELITGIITKSLSLQSDAWHMLSDEMSLIIGLVAHEKAKKPPTKKYTFSLARAEVIGGFTNAIFLLAVCMTILFEAIERFIKVEEIVEPKAFLIVGILGLLVNAIGIFIFHDHHHSDNIQGIFLHIIGDLLGSVAVVISAAVCQWTTWNGRFYLDPACSIFIFIILVYGSQGLLRRTGSILLESCPEYIDVELIKADLMKIEGIVAVHELHVWELCKEIYLALLHVVVDSKERNKKVLEQCHNIMISHGVYSTTVQIEFVDDFPQGTDSVGSCFYATSFGSDKRIFQTPPVYQHSIGCPHVNLPGHEHDHDHDDHDHAHLHSHSHDHLHNEMQGNLRTPLNE